MRVGHNSDGVVTWQRVVNECPPNGSPFVEPHRYAPFVLNDLCPALNYLCDTSATATKGMPSQHVFRSSSPVVTFSVIVMHSSRFAHRHFSACSKNALIV